MNSNTTNGRAAGISMRRTRLQTGMTDPVSESLWALVLAGGDGTRLQSLTYLIGSGPILKHRSSPQSERSRSSNRDHLAIARPQLTSLDPRNVWAQPRNLDTGPGVLVSMLELARRDPDAAVAMFPSDHYVRDGAAFRQSSERMCRVVAGVPEWIALVGAHPEHADGGYGYITAGRPLVPGADTFEVRAFHESPLPALPRR